MKLTKYTLLLFVLTGLFFACSDDDDFTTPDIPAPSNVAAAISIAQNDSGEVTVTPTADGAVSFEVFFGDVDNEEATVVPVGGNATNTYSEGTFTLRIIAIGSDGQRTETTQEVVVSFAAPSNLAINVAISEDNSLEVSVSPTADNAMMFDILFGDEADGEEATSIVAGDSASNTYIESGEFTITVTARSASATTVEGSETVTLTFDAGLLTNGDFSSGAEPWNAGVEAFDAPPAPVVTENGNTFYSVNVENPDPSQPFLINLSQQGLTLDADTNYLLTFTAWSDRDRTIIAGIGESGPDSFAGSSVDVDLTTEMQTFTLNLNTVGFGGTDNRVLFDSNGAAGTVNIDNVILVEGGDGSDSLGNGGGDPGVELLINGDFEAGAEPWNAGVEEFGAPPAPVVTENGNTFYSVNVDTPDPSQPFLVNLSQQGLSLTADTNYVLTFDAWSDRDRTIIAGIGESSGGFANTTVTVDLTTQTQTFTLNLNTIGFGGDDLRVLFDSNAEAGLVNIDNVSLVQGGDGSDTLGDISLLVNGDFEAGAEPWNAGVEEFGAPPAPVVTENGNTFYSVNVDNPDPSQPFLVNLSQQGLSLSADTNYVLTFDAWSDRDRTLISGIGESSGGFASSVVTVNLTTQMQTFTLNLNTVGFGGDDLRVLFDSNGEAGLVNIDNVSLTVGGDGSDSLGDISLLVNGDFEAGAEPWNAGVEEFGAPPAPVVTENGNTFYSVNVDTPDPSQPFLVNLSQQGLSLTADTNYVLTFDAWSDRDRTIIAGIGESSGGFASTTVTVNLTTTMQTFTFNLTTVDFSGDDLRVLFDSNAEAGLVNIDNVTLVEGGDGSDTP